MKWHERCAEENHKRDDFCLLVIILLALSVSLGALIYFSVAALL